MQAAEEMYGHGYTFGITSIPDAFTNYNVTQDDIILFKEFDEGRSDFKGKRGWNVKHIADFIVGNSLPQLIEFNTRIAPRILSVKEKGALYLVMSSSSQEYLPLKELASRIANDWKHKILTVIIDSSKEENKPFINQLIVNDDDGPVLRFAYGMEKKYIPQSTDISETVIKRFVSEVLNGIIKPMLWTKSDEVPKDWKRGEWKGEGTVKVLVGKNFHEVIEKSKKKYVFVEFYDSSCERCQAFAPIWEQLGDTFKDTWGIDIAKMDGTANELESLEISAYPTLLLFKGNVNNYVPFHEDPTLEVLVKFLKDQGIKPDKKPKRDEL